MYLSSITMKNFRCFGEDAQTMYFNEGLTILVGENDSGKSTVIDAIKLALGSTDQSWQRIELSDFYKEETSREIQISCKFQNLSVEEQAAFLECLTYEKEIAVLYIHLNAKYLTSIKPNRTAYKVSSGRNRDVMAPSAEARELLRVTYLRALRDANSEMQAGKNSRLSRIVNNLEDVNAGKQEYIEGESIHELSLTAIADLSNKLLANHKKLRETNLVITNILNEKMLLRNDIVNTKISVAGSESSEERKLVGLLEKLDLSIDKAGSSHPGRVGLGTSNILSMACELLLDQTNMQNGFSSFLLIEEPEAHIHAQRQLKLIQSLQLQAFDRNQQIIITTHSPLLASVVSLKNIVLLKDGKAYPMAETHTKLLSDDYRFLERYLDATKANLFFARRVLVVEGPGEELLLPTIAKLLGKSFVDYGVSLVNVMSTGLRRYARIFQRTDEQNVLDLRVACITDRDIMPDCAPEICLNTDYKDKANWPQRNDRRWSTESEVEDNKLFLAGITGKADGQSVKTFVADHWTLEYDLAYAGMIDEMLSAAILLQIRDLEEESKKSKQDTLYKKYQDKVNLLQTQEEKASYVYSLFSKKVLSKAEFAQQFADVLEQKYSNGKSAELLKRLPKYIVAAIDYVTE